MFAHGLCIEIFFKVNTKTEGSMGVLFTFSLKSLTLQAKPAVRTTALIANSEFSLFEEIL